MEMTIRLFSLFLAMTIGSSFLTGAEDVSHSTNSGRSLLAQIAEAKSPNQIKAVELNIINFIKESPPPSRDQLGELLRIYTRIHNVYKANPAAEWILTMRNVLIVMNSYVDWDFDGKAKKTVIDYEIFVNKISPSFENQYTDLSKIEINKLSEQQRQEYQLLLKNRDDYLKKERQESDKRFFYRQSAYHLYQVLLIARRSGTATDDFVQKATEDIRYINVNDILSVKPAGESWLMNPSTGQP